MLFFRILTACLMGYVLTVSNGGFAANLAKGKALYTLTPNNLPIPFNCADSGCHKSTVDGNFPNGAAKKTAAGIKSAIAANSGGMGGIYGPVPGVLTNANIDDIAAYIANPAAGAILTASTTSLTFPTTAFGTSPAPSQTITVTNTGLANLSVTSAVTSGANAADFNVTNNCTAAVASNGTCNIAVVMSTATSGAKSATLTIASNGGNQAVTITGTVGGSPSVGLNAPTGGLTFPDTTVGSASAANNLPPSGIVTLTNSGSAPLNISALTASAGFTLDQTPASACKIATPVAATQTCTLSVKFAPGSAGAKSGSLAIAHNGSASPATMALSGKGVAATTPTPAAELDKTALVFGDQVIGTTSVTQQVTLTNGGSKPLTISNIQDSNGEFVRTGTCAAGQLAIGATCTIIVAFTPVSATSVNGTILITDDAGNVAGTVQTIALSGSGKATALSAPNLTATALDFGNQSLNTASDTKTVTLSNTSATDSLVISSLSLTGASAGEYAIDNTVANACSSTVAVSASGSCDISLKFTPTASGARDAVLTVATNATGSPHQVTLTGTGSTTSGPASTPSSSTNVGGGGCVMHIQGGVDPTLPVLFSLSSAYLLSRRRRSLVPLNSNTANFFRRH